MGTLYASDFNLHIYRNNLLYKDITPENRDSYMWREIRVNERRKLILNYLSYFGGAYFIIEYY